MAAVSVEASGACIGREMDDSLLGVSDTVLKKLLVKVCISLFDIRCSPKGRFISRVIIKRLWLWLMATIRTLPQTQIKHAL